jgi:hypothetical protein
MTQSKIITFNKNKNTSLFFLKKEGFLNINKKIEFYILNNKQNKENTSNKNFVVIRNTSFLFNTLDFFIKKNLNDTFYTNKKQFFLRLQKFLFSLEKSVSSF